MAAKSKDRRPIIKLRSTADTGYTSRKRRGLNSDQSDTRFDGLRGNGHAREQAAAANRHAQDLKIRKVDQHF